MTRKKFQKKKNEKLPLKQLVLTGIVVMIVGLLVISGTFYGIKIYGKRSLEASAVSSGKMEKKNYITYMGKKYQYNEEMVNILCMGTDQRGELQDLGLVGQGGQADVIVLAALDSAGKTMKAIAVSRDTMIEVACYDTQGEYIQDARMQICLQYAYGRTKKESCFLMKQIVSELFYGIPIHGYGTINLDAIPIVNDAVGGVEVTLEDDFSEINPDMQQGTTMTLNGEQAMTYLWERESLGLDNSARMVRQKNYLVQFMAKAKEAVQQDITLPLSIYEQVKPYTITDISPQQMTHLATLAVQCPMDETSVIQVPGESVLSGNYTEFTVNEEEFYDLIIQTFYKEVIGEAKAQEKSDEKK